MSSSISFRGTIFPTPSSSRVPVTIIPTSQTTVSVPSISFSPSGPSTSSIYLDPLLPSDAPSAVSLSNTAIIIISVSAAVVILAIGAVVSCLLRRKQRQKQRNGPFFAIPGSSKTEKFAISRHSSTSSFSARPPPSAQPQSSVYKQDTAHSPLLQEAWRPSFESSSRDYVVRETQNYDSNRSSPKHILTPTPSHTRTLSQSTTTTCSSEDTASIMASAPVKINHSPYRQSIPLPPLSIPSPSVPAQHMLTSPPPPPPPPPPKSPRRQPSSRRTQESYDSDGSESVYSQGSGYPDTPTPLASQSVTTHATHTTNIYQSTYPSTILLPSAIDQNYRASNVYSFPNHPARASSVFSAHPQFVDIPGLPGHSAPVPSREPDLEEGIRRPSETLFAPIQPVIIRYDKERTGPSRGESLIIGRLLKSRARNRESNSTSGTAVSRNSSMVSHIERQGSIRGVSSPLVSEDGGHRVMRSLNRQPSRLSTTAEGYYFDEQEPLPSESDFLNHAAAEAPSPTGAAEGGMFSPLTPPSSSADPSTHIRNHQSFGH